MEIWKTIKDYPNYQVSNLGNVMSLNYKLKGKPHLLKQNIKRNGYAQVVLYNENGKKDKLVHRLVAQAFIPNPDNKPEVNHIDEGRTHNSVDNLEWCDATYNKNYGHRTSRASKKIMKKIRCVETGVIYNGQVEAEKLTGISHKKISKACTGDCHTGGGYHWEYVCTNN